MSEINDIYNEIGGAAFQEEALAELDLSGDTATQLRADVDQGSEVDIFRIVAWLFSAYMVFQRILWRIYRKDVKDLALDGHYGTVRWYVAKAREFQYGSDLIFTDRDAYYSPVLPGLRIVTHSAVVEMAYKVILKVAKANGSGGLTYLNSAERNGLQDYFNEIRPLVAVEIRSSKADLVRFVGKVIADAKLGTPGIQANVEVAVNNYLKTLDFNGVISRTKLKLSILAVPGVIDVVIDTLQTKFNPDSPWLNVNRIAMTYAGYAVISSDFPLSDNITYLNSNV